VYVGKSDAENDVLTHEFASASDLWFHAQGTPGSHVVLKGAHRSTPHSVIEAAASIAAYFSKARNSSTVPVIYAEKRHVRRPRKSKAGTALCSRGKTIFVKPALPEKE
jgi:predicted ribosome quality control (RQC) complex YloA/Tae2 family protein